MARGVVAPPMAPERASLGWPAVQSRDASSGDHPTAEMIRASLDERFRLHRRLKTVPIHIVADGGTVILLGVVPGALERSLAGRFALDTDGVSRVENQLSIIAPESQRDSLQPERADRELEVDAVRGLSLSRRLGDETLQVVVRRGIAHLSGVLENDSDRIYAAEIVAGIPGIHGVKNGLVVQPLADREIPGGDVDHIEKRA